MFGRLAGVAWIGVAIGVAPWLYVGLLTPAPLVLLLAIFFVASLLSHPGGADVLLASVMLGAAVGVGSLAVPLTSPYGYSLQWPNVLAAVCAFAAAAASLVQLNTEWSKRRPSR